MVLFKLKNYKKTYLILITLTILGCGRNEKPKITFEEGLQTEEQVYKNQQKYASEDIIGGYPIYDIREVPWQVGLLEPEQDIQCFCGGSIINEQWILTAAHCLYYENWLGNSVKRKTDELYVFANSSNLNSGGIIYDVIQIIEHPAYDEQTLDNDLALLQLSQPITQMTPNQHITAMDINEYNNLNTLGTELLVTGWGATSTTGQNPSDILMRASVNVKNHVACINNYQVIGDIITDNMVCASGYNTDSCFGDSGGPLYTVIDDRGILVGITSKGGPNSCADDKLFGVYTNVFNYIDWINSHCNDCFIIPLGV